MPFSMIPTMIGSLKNFSLSTTNAVIALGIIGIEQIFQVAAYKCPCLTAGGKPHTLGNRVYGLVFLLVPAFVLLILGFALNHLTWRLFTGFCRRKKKKNENSREIFCCTFFAILMRACVAPISWICIALLDGHYYACAMTKVPYSESCEIVYTRDRPPPYSVDYHVHIAKSQMLGWIVTAVAFGVSCFVFTLYRCCSKFTYLQKQYVELTGSIEREVFREKAREEIRTRAENNFNVFWREIELRKKKDWDDVSRIHHVDLTTEVTCYSGAQNWVKELEKKKGGIVNIASSGL